jgi:hypothetical protein
MLRLLHILITSGIFGEGHNLIDVSKYIFRSHLITSVSFPNIYAPLDSVSYTPAVYAPNALVYYLVDGTKLELGQGFLFPSAGSQ